MFQNSQILDLGELKKQPGNAWSAWFLVYCKFVCTDLEIDWKALQTETTLLENLYINIHICICVCILIHFDRFIYTEHFDSLTEICTCHLALVKKKILWPLSLSYASQISFIKMFLNWLKTNALPQKRDFLTMSISILIFLKIYI